MYRRHRLAAFSFGVTVPTFGASMSPPFHPCIPTRAPQPPSRGRWVHEIKQGGYRLIVRRVGEHVSLRTKGGYDWAECYPRIARSVLKLRVESVALDGEVVWLTETGVSDFDTLHSRRKDDWAMHLAFDILELDGTDLRDLPLVERKRRLKALLGCQDDGLQFVEHLEGDGPAIFEAACQLGLEGIVSKRADSAYKAGPSKMWLKTKNRNHPALVRVAESFDRHGR
jgi:bifunctional non-homologous end joining protein LigD